MNGGALITRRLRDEERPGFCLRSKLSLEFRREFYCLRCFERVCTGPRRGPCSERSQPGGVHFACRREPLDVPHVEIAPPAGGLSRRETMHVPLVVQSLDDPINPPEAKCLVHSFL